MLDAQGLADDTIVIFTSDHGEWLGDHLRYGKGYPGPDVVSRVPFIVRWPNGNIAVRQTVHEIVEAVDVVPTLLECAGIQIAPHLQGESLYGVMHDSTAARAGMALMEATGWKHLRTARYRYVVHDDGRECLWDLENDPLEYHDVAEDEAYAGILAEHRHLLLQRLLRAERPRARIWPY